MALSPSVYARLLGERIGKHQAAVWLINTGWTGGPYGVGRRMPIAQTRAMLRAALDGKLADVPTKLHPIFRIAMPVSCPEVPSDVLDPRETWADKAAYDAQARRLAQMFRANFDSYAPETSPEVREAGPRVD